MPNCASSSTPSAISAHLPPKRKIRNKGDVPVFWGIPSRLLYLGGTVGATGSRSRADELGARSIREISQDLWLPQDQPLAPEAKRHWHEPQGGLALDAQTEHSLGGSQAKDLPKPGQV